MQRMAQDIAFYFTVLHVFCEKLTSIRSNFSDLYRFARLHCEILNYTRFVGAQKRHAWGICEKQADRKSVV